MLFVHLENTRKSLLIAFVRFYFIYTISCTCKLEFINLQAFYSGLKDGEVMMVDYFKSVMVAMTGISMTCYWYCSIIEAIDDRSWSIVFWLHRIINHHDGIVFIWYSSVTSKNLFPIFIMQKTLLVRSVFFTLYQQRATPKNE